uniref:Ketosynthase family 3 (KS3) domain-containing protein n=1 Tax=Aplanochytrium stocchinoi TaxID=215587 RepID=A0A7S3PGY4_9STRA
MLSSKFPGSFGSSSAKEYLAFNRGLGKGRIDSVLIHSLSMQPKGRFANADEAKKWLDSVCTAYGKWAGVDLSASTSQIPQSGNMVMGSTSQMPSVLMEKFQKWINNQVESCYEFLERDPHMETRKVWENERKLRKEAEASLESLKIELGEEFCDVIQPQHDSNKVRIYDSYWNWVIQDALELHYHTLACVRNATGSKVPVPNGDNSYFRAMSSWITASDEALNSDKPPQAWFRNYLCNRATPDLLTVVKYFAEAMNKAGHPGYAQAITLLAEQVSQWINRPPVHIALFASHQPNTRLDENNNYALKYEEIPRKFKFPISANGTGEEFKCSDAVMYVKEMSRGLYYDLGAVSRVENPSQGVDLTSDNALIHDEEKLDAMSSGLRLPRSETELARDMSKLPKGSKLEVMRKSVKRTNSFDGTEVVDDAVLVSNDYDSIHVTKQVPFIHIKSPSNVDKTVRVVDEPLTSKYLSCMHDIATNGLCFAGQVALITGAGEGSIGFEVVKPLLEGGATVIITVRTNRTDERMQAEYSRFQKVYEEFGSRGSKLVIEPCNGASKQDMESLVKHIYNELNLDLDLIIPFAAVAENGKDISDIDSHAEGAHRVMLTNTIRLLGNVKRAKQDRGIETRPAMVLVPCSPNHGDFGMDGLYAESKLGLEALVNKWSSENWENYLSIGAAVIGWTRSKLMWQNNVVAEGIENLGVRTFSTTETAFNLIGLLHPEMIYLAAEKPIWADLTGNWIAAPDLNKESKKIRQQLYVESKTAKAKSKSTFVAAELGSPSLAVDNSSPLDMYVKGESELARLPLANPQRMCNPFPKLPLDDRLKSLSHLHNMVDLRETVVVVGYGEIGPWGSSRTRWEMESYGEFSLEGAIELAWLVGLIKPHNGPMKNNPRQQYFGWLDASTGEPVADHEIKRRYEETMLKHAGVRLIEPELFEGYDPKRKHVLRQVAIDRNMKPIEVSSYEEAQQYSNEIGKDFVDIYNEDPVDLEGQWFIRLKAGAVISIPRALKFDRLVAGQIPTGWDAKRMGVPEDIANSVDPVTLYALISTVEALISAGLTDPYELYEYVHVSQVGNTSGGGMGGMRSLKRIFLQRKVDVEIPSDTLAESFINTMPAWVNMLLLSSSGPIKTPVGACATAAESVDIGVETILSKKARVVICGGYDDFGETGSTEFAMMGATSNSELEISKGRFPGEASRPMTDTRSGFMESQGAGMQVLMDAELAVDMGLPIYAVVALSNTATDKQGRSVPAPGKGILTTAREVNSNTSKLSGEASNACVGKNNPLLSIHFRSENLKFELEEIDSWESVRKGEIFQDGSGEAAVLNGRLQMVIKMAAKKRAAAYATWGQGFYKDDASIAPLRGALAVWGLTIDDLAVGSFHGTSTKLNDKNESSLVNKQLEHLGRDKGNILLVITQKYLTGHPKGAAAAWMLNGLVQCMNSKRVPGNRNLDNVSPELQKNGYLFYPNRTIEVPKIEATFLKSFGFGQAGAEVILVNPDYLLAVLDDETRANYIEKRNQREESAYRYQQGVFSGKHSMVQVKSFAPYEDEQLEDVYLDPLARASFDASKNTWTFYKYNQNLQNNKPVKEEIKLDKLLVKQSNDQTSAAPILKTSVKARLQVTIQEKAEGLAEKADSRSQGVGVDVEPVLTFADYKNKTTFLARNFTEREQSYCNKANSPAASYAGRWAAKEAVIKALSNSAPGTRSLWQGAEAPLIDIEIVQSSSGAPEIVLHGHAKEVFQALGLNEVKVSISHTAEVAVAQALTL